MEFLKKHFLDLVDQMDYPELGKLYLNLADKLREPEIITDEEGEYEEILFGVYNDKYEATFNFYKDLIQELQRFENYKKADLTHYKIDGLQDFNSSEIEKFLDKKVFSIYKATQLIEKLKNCNTLEELDIIKPLTLFTQEVNFTEENIPEQFLIPPFTLGNRATTVIAYDDEV